MTTSRKARCTYYKGCGSEAFSDNPNLAFFMDKSAPQDKCEAVMENGQRCGYAAIAHERFSGRLNDVVRAGHWPPNVQPHEHVQPTAGEPVDEYYCGCFGWD